MHVSKTRLRPAPDLYLSVSLSVLIVFHLPHSWFAIHFWQVKAWRSEWRLIKMKLHHVSSACVNTACPFMTCMWAKSPKELCQYFHPEQGWTFDSMRPDFNVSLADKISHLLAPKFAKFRFSNFKSHRLAPHIALAWRLRLWFSTRRGYWSGSDEQWASRPDSECRSHI